MKRKCWVLASFVLIASASIMQAAERKLNVLMILVDDLAPVVSAYGGPVVTPSIDQLAAQGVLFANNYANVPVCGASRASMLSGLSPNASRFLSYDSRLDEDVENAVSLPAYFRAHGWHTAANGKVFDVIADSAAGWSEPVWSPGDDWFGKEPDGRGEHLQSAYIEPLGSGRSPYFERLDVVDAAYPDGQVAIKSAEDLQRLARSDKPFFLAVGFRKPHLPFNAPEKYWQSVSTPDEMLAATWFEPAAGMPGGALHRSPELRSQYDALPYFGDPDDADAAEIVNAYHAAVRYADAQVGVVLQGLADAGAVDNTIVVLMGDHGFLVGDQRMWTKHTLFESALRTPLIISHPGAVDGRKASPVTDLLDVFPTVAELAGLEIPDHVNGVSLGPLLANPGLKNRQSKKGSISRWMNGESVRLGDYRYTRWFNESGETVEEMLFDLESDPLEQVNLIGDTEHKRAVKTLGAYLEIHRSDLVWSAKLDEQYALWQLASSPVGGVLMVSLAYPILAALVLLLIGAGIVILIMRYRKKR